MKFDKVNFGFILLTIFLQLSFFSNFKILGATANIVLGFVVWLALTSDIDSIIISSYVGGFLLDLYSASPFGLNIFGLLITGFVIFFMTNEVFKKGGVQTYPLFLVFGFAFYRMLAFAFSYFSQWWSESVPVTLSGLFHIEFFYSLVYTLVISMLIIYLHDKFFMNDQKKARYF